MKYLLLSILLFVFFYVDVRPASAAMQTDTIDRKIVLIINSYRQDIEWSSELQKQIEDHFQSNDHADVYSGNLNTDIAILPSTASLTLRSILWALAEDTRKAPDATSLRYREIFTSNVIPDALVFIGDEGFMNHLDYLNYLDRWQSVPIILCNVHDSIAASGWNPLRNETFHSMWNIDDYRMVSSSVYKSSPDLPFIRQNQKLWATRKDSVMYGAECYRIRVELDLSGVRVNTPVRKNLELIHRLMPGLKELVWVDNDYYQANYALKRLRDVMPEVMPDVKLSVMLHNRMNTDSIFDVMLEPASNRAFISYTWNIDALYSKRSDAEIDSLFTSVASVPLFTLTQRPFTDNYWVGGYYPLRDEIIDRTICMLEQVLKGTAANDIPFETVENGNFLLNKTALERYGLTKNARALEEAIYVHIPLNFYQRNEGSIMIAVVLLAILGGCTVYVVRRRRFNRRIEAASLRYKRLYDKLQAIYGYSSIDFALYNMDGQRLVCIAKGKKVSESRMQNDLFPIELFSASYLDEEQRLLVRERKTVNREVAFDEQRKFSDYTFDGQEVYQLIVKPLHNTGNDSFSYMVIAINLTPVVREQEEKMRFENLFHFASDSSQVGVAFYNIHTTLGMATDSWYQNLNEPFEANALPKYLNLEPEIRTRLLDFQKKALAGKVEDSLTTDARVTGGDGKQHWIHLHLFYVPEREQLIELNVNIDRQKQSETQLSEAKQKAEKANVETSQFLSNISHEIRTPLNSIVGFSAVLASVDEQDEEFKSIILRNNKLLKDVINNVLDLSEIDSGAVIFKQEPVDLLQFFTEMENYIRTDLFDKFLKIVIDLPEKNTIVYTDYTYLRLILMNLLANAVKFTETGEIKMGYKQEEKHFRFYVKDTGCGISLEDQERIFKRFEKLDSYMQGTGLGLALCKSIVQHLGGTIGVDSVPGEGSTFWFVLPLER